MGKMSPKLILDFEQGLDHPPVVYPVTDNDKDVEQLEKFSKAIAKCTSRKAARRQSRTKGLNDR